MCQGLGADEAEGDRERGKGSEGNERFGKACARRAEAGIDQGVPMIQSPFTCCPALALQPPLSPSGTVALPGSGACSRPLMDGQTARALQSHAVSCFSTGGAFISRMKSEVPCVAESRL